MGIYQCYCDATLTEQILLGKSSICWTYNKDLAGGYALSEAMTVVITLVNMIIRDIAIVFIEYIGYHTETE